MEKTREELALITNYFADFTDTQLDQFAKLGDLYNDWNSKINVISRKDIEALYEKHILHSLAIAAVIEFKPGTQIIDIGTGGGFPGIPLAIFFPETQFHLVDSIGKKLKVVEDVAQNIGLTNVTIQHTRAEDIKNRKWDFVVSRAVAPIKDLWRWGKPLIKKGHEHDLKNGLICLKGGDLAQEIFESNLRPNIVNIESLFTEPSFKEKFMLHVGF